MNLSPFSLRRIKRKLLLITKNARHLVFLAVFCFVTLQPHHFVIEATIPQDINAVHASYTTLLEQSKQKDDVMLFDTLNIDADGKTSITYTIAPGDTLSSISQDFGTTVDVLLQTNPALIKNSALRVGQKIVVSFTENFIYQVPESISLGDLAEKYELNIQDLMSLNYIESPEKKVDQGQELVLPLTKTEAINKGLATPEEFVPLDLGEEEEIIEDELWIEGQEDEEREDPSARSPWIDDSAQEIITPEQTETHLKNLENKQKEALLAQEEADRKQAELAKKKEELAKKKKEEPIKKPTQPKNNECSTNQCLHDGKCRTKPANAVCAPQDPDDAWVCKEGFIDTGKSCVAKTAAKKTTKVAEKKVDKGVLSQWYFNAKKAGYPNDRGRAGGHCTQYVDYRRWKNLGKRTYRRGNAKYRYNNAAAAGASVGKTPQNNAAVVFNAGSNSYRGYGHVAIVLEIDRDNSLILIEEQNYVGTYVVSQRRVSMQGSGIIGYVYP